MATFQKAIAKSELAPGHGRVVDLGVRKVALFNVEGNIYALDNTCPHRGGPLGEGDLAGCVVTCPWHAWTFDVTTGNGTQHPASVQAYPVRVEGDDILVSV